MIAIDLLFVRMQGRHAEARRVFEGVLSRCNDVGLLAEENDPLTTGLSHVGLINCALNPSRQAGPAEERAQNALAI